MHQFCVSRHNNVSESFEFSLTYGNKSKNSIDTSIMQQNRCFYHSVMVMCHIGYCTVLSRHKSVAIWRPAVLCVSRRRLRMLCQVAWGNIEKITTWLPEIHIDIVNTEYSRHIFDDFLVKYFPIVQNVNSKLDELLIYYLGLTVTRQSFKLKANNTMFQSQGTLNRSAKDCRANRHFVQIFSALQSCSKNLLYEKSLLLQQILSSYGKQYD